VQRLVELNQKYPAYDVELAGAAAKKAAGETEAKTAAASATTTP
jgi:hypothetical protein